MTNKKQLTSKKVTVLIVKIAMSAWTVAQIVIIWLPVRIKKKDMTVTVKLVSLEMALLNARTSTSVYKEKTIVQAGIIYFTNTIL